MKFKNILIFIVLIDLLLSLALKFFSFSGDNSEETKKIILQYFSEADILSGIQYSQRGFASKLFLEILQTILISGLVFTNFSSLLENKISSFTKDKLLPTVVLFLLSIYFIRFILFIPFDFYFNFHLEHEFGFSKMTILDWIILKMKSVTLTILGLSFFGILIVFILKKFQKTWIFILPISTFFISLIMIILVPIFITPIFYKYEPISESSLKEKIILLSKKANVNIESIYIIKESQYSNHTNAYFTGFGENKKIFLYDTLVNNHTEDEVISVLGHEIGHWKNSHQFKDLIYSLISSFFICLLLSKLFSIAKREQSFHLSEIYSPSTLPFLFLTFQLINSFTDPFWSYLSRSQETEADIEALVLTNDKKSFIDTEIKMAKDNKSRLNPHPFVEFYSYSHPKTIDRIKLAEKFNFKENIK